MLRCCKALKEEFMSYTEDTLLNGRIILRQPEKGYRVAIDPIFLAASVNVQEGDNILDIGAGVGAASLCLAFREKQCRITGLEIQHEYVKLASENIVLNNMRGRVEILHGDLLKAPPRLAAGTFSHIIANPPYLEEFCNREILNLNKKVANLEGMTKLDDWIKFSLMMVRPKGYLTFIHRADRLDQIISGFAGKLGDIQIFPLWSHVGKPSKRIIVRGQKNSNGKLTLHAGLVLHESNGDYTKKAQAILRDGHALEF